MNTNKSKISRSNFGFRSRLRYFVEKTVFRTHFFSIFDVENVMKKGGFEIITHIIGKSRRTPLKYIQVHIYNIIYVLYILYLYWFIYIFLFFFESNTNFEIDQYTKMRTNIYTRGTNLKGFQKIFPHHRFPI